VNFRDLGGYKTSNGKHTKWGKIFRSDNLSRLTDRDQIKLKNMNIKLVCDFRTGAEIKKSPNKFPGDAPVRYLHMPIIHGEFDNTTLFNRIKKGDIGWISIDFMIKGYIQSLEEYADTFGHVIKMLTKPRNIPMVFHCTAGKDRTGTFAALLLMALDVPEKTVIEDHGLSNILIAKVLDKMNEYLKSYGIDPQLVSPYLTAPKECIVSMIHHINTHYGSVHNYLTKKAGLNPKIIASLKENLLE